jgi:hypothetical protein
MRFMFENSCRFAKASDLSGERFGDAVVELRTGRIHQADQNVEGRWLQTVLAGDVGSASNPIHKCLAKALSLLPYLSFGGGACVHLKERTDD